MPVYDYLCNSCGDTLEIFHSIADCSRTQLCQYCFSKMQRMLSAPRIQMDYPPYQCPVSGRWIDGKKAHRENLERHGCRVLETGEHEANLRRRREADEKLENSLGETIAKEVARLPPEKQSRLCEEMARGTTATVERR